MSFKICYIWIRNFRNFENFGFNLSSSEKFDFDVENFKLSRREINDVPRNFFGDDISDVVGFIGKNGAGKLGECSLETAQKVKRLISS